MTRPSGKLSDEDRIIWNMVARTAQPLKGKPPLPRTSRKPAVRLDGDAAGRSAGRVAAAGAEAPPNARPGQARIRSTSRRATSSPRAGLPIDARVDLHGMTQGEAHGLLLSFLHRAHASGLRYVLVITGKGASFGSEGVLKRAVPAWLSTPPFRTLVGSHDARGAPAWRRRRASTSGCGGATSRASHDAVRRKAARTAPRARASRKSRWRRPSASAPPICRRSSMAGAACRAGRWSRRSSAISTSSGTMPRSCSGSPRRPIRASSSTRPDCRPRRRRSPTCWRRASPCSTRTRLPR